MFRNLALALCCAGISWGPLQAGVVVNEIFYHAPNELNELQFIELHNPDAAAVEIAGWKFTRGITFEFPLGAKIESGGYVVISKNKIEFRRHYGFDAAGEYTGSLSHDGETIEFVDAAGRKVDSVKYKSRAPWPVAPDGYSSSLERICPTEAGTGPENWAPSPLADDLLRPGGTPGRRNSNFAALLPPIIENITILPPHALSNQPIRVDADIRSPAEPQVELRYRVAGTGYERAETSLKMTKGSSGRYSATIPAQKAGQLVRIRIHAAMKDSEVRWHPHPQEIRPALSVCVHDRLQLGKLPLGFIINVGKAPNRGDATRATSPAHGGAAYVHVDVKTGEPRVFDFITVTPRKAGHRVRLHKDQTLDGMSTISLIFEYHDRFVLAEPLAYEVYRKAGNAAPRTDFVRTWIDGRPIGYQLLIEQPNRSFLRHNKLRTDGNMYKIIWWGNDLISQHEKKTNIHGNHDDLVQIVRQLGQTKGEEQWNLIKKYFDVEQVINYFAVNAILSHWDGYFNNYFTYHDAHGTGKWTIYPWDQDKTWGFHDGIGGYEVFFDMPLTFGMEGDQAGVGGVWWRPGGAFSRPLLANPTFRKLYLARIKELLDKVYTEEMFLPIIKDMGLRVEEDVRYRAQLHGQDPRQAVLHLQRNLGSLRDHLQKRRTFLLAQDEIKKAGMFDRQLLK